MNDNAKKWAEFLPKFPQAQGQLRTAEGYCCLGVGCELYRRETGRGQWRQTPEGQWEFVIDGEYAIANLPEVVRKWLGLAEHDGAYAPTYDQGSDASLANDNDSGDNFDEIAATILAEPEGLFA